MENSVKALYMTVGALLGIMILSLLVYVFSQGGKFFGAAEERKARERIEAFNSQFEVYNTLGEHLNSYNTIYDVVTACNLAHDINVQNDFDNSNNVIVVLTCEGVTYTLELNANQKGKIGTKNLNDLLRDYGELDEVLVDVDQNTERPYKFKYSGQIEYNNSTGKVNRVIFEQQ